MPYRDDSDALRARRDELQKDLKEVAERAVALESLLKSRDRIERELADIDARLARAASGRRSLLDDVRIASPCDASWDAMHGDERVRFCEKCHKNVYNLSAMSRDEAEALIVATDGDLCARIYQRADGTVLSTDCPVGTRRKRVRRLAMVAVTTAGALAAMVGAGLTATQGKMAVQPPPEPLPPQQVEPEPMQVKKDAPPERLRPRMGGIRMHVQENDGAKGKHDDLGL